jgi:hypothetical protein
MAQLDLKDRFLDSLGLLHCKNEVLMFHGCPGKGSWNPVLPGDDAPRWTAQDEPSLVDAVSQQGFDGRVGSSHGMLGAGTYFADMACKADCYAGKYNPRDIHETDQAHDRYKPATIFLARVVLGTPYLTEQPLEGIRRPPSLNGYFDPSVKDVPVTHPKSKPWSNKGLEIKLSNDNRYDSVVCPAHHCPGGPRPLRMYSEFVVYDKQAYPEFRVQYSRVKRTRGATGTV